jgi:hypothetical protein
LPALAARLMPEDPPLELVLELELLDVPELEYEQYLGLSTLIGGNSEPEQVIGPVSVAYTKVPDFPYATDRVPVNEQVSPSLAHLM